MNPISPREIVRLAQRALECPPQDDHLRAITGDHSPPAYAPYISFVYYVVERLAPMLALELGVQVGRTMAHMCHAAPDGATIVGVDHDPVDDPKQSNCTTYYLRPYSNWRLIRKDASEFLRGFYGQFDLVHWDTSHELSASMTEWPLIRSHMVKGGVVLVDDVDMVGPAYAWNNLMSDEHETRICLPNLHGSGYGAVICL